MRLSELDKGGQAMILAIEGRELEIHLLRLGLVVGDVVEISNLAPFGGPIALKIVGSKVAMRRSDAALITVKPL